MKEELTKLKEKKRSIQKQLKQQAERTSAELSTMKFDTEDLRQELSDAQQSPHDAKEEKDLINTQSTQLQKQNETPKINIDHQLKESSEEASHGMESLKTNKEKLQQQLKESQRSLSMAHKENQYTKGTTSRRKRYSGRKNWTENERTEKRSITCNGISIDGQRKSPQTEGSATIAEGNAERERSNQHTKHTTSSRK
jgi:chromosome segregation ATPase